MQYVSKYTSEAWGVSFMNERKSSTHRPIAMDLGDNRHENVMLTSHSHSTIRSTTRWTEYTGKKTQHDFPVPTSICKVCGISCEPASESIDECFGNHDIAERRATERAYFGSCAIQKMVANVVD